MSGYGKGRGELTSRRPVPAMRAVARMGPGEQAYDASGFVGEREVFGSICTTSRLERSRQFR